jgi:hypothetical protein
MILSELHKYVQRNKLYLNNLKYGHNIIIIVPDQ